MLTQINATDYIFSSPEDNVRHPLYRLSDEAVQTYVDYGPGASWEVEQFWPVKSGPLTHPSDMMDQNVLVQAKSTYYRDGNPKPTLAPCLNVGTENQYRCYEDGKTYLDTSSSYTNAVFCPITLELGHHTYRSLGTVIWTKHQSPLASTSDPARTVQGKFEYLITLDISADEHGNVSVTLVEEFWQGMADTDKAGFKRGNRGNSDWGYRRFQRYDQDRGLVFLHNLPVPSAPEEWIAKRWK